jgi:hypothetical protein
VGEWERESVEDVVVDVEMGRANEKERKKNTPVVVVNKDGQTRLLIGVE